MVGSIIGPGGKLINEIRVESGAKIHISPKEPNRKDRDVLITGNLDSIAKALKMLHFYLEQEKERKALE
jgi:polyribonucleotide nucleotidyltransferase